MLQGCVTIRSHAWVFHCLGKKSNSSGTQLVGLLFFSFGESLGFALQSLIVFSVSSAAILVMKQPASLQSLWQRIRLCDTWIWVYLPFLSPPMLTPGTHFMLQGNKIGVLGLEALTAALEENTVLQKLDISVITIFAFLFSQPSYPIFSASLQNNKIKPKAAVELFKALKKNTALLELHLQVSLLSFVLLTQLNWRNRIMWLEKRLVNGCRRHWLRTRPFNTSIYRYLPISLPGRTALTWITSTQESGQRRQLPLGKALLQIHLFLPWNWAIMTLEKRGASP